MSNLYKRYFNELINLFPSMNDWLNLSDYSHLKNQYENSLSKEHIQKQKNLYEHYLNQLNKKSNHNVYDKCLKYILTENMLSFSFNFDLTPINHQENFITYLAEMATGEGVYMFNKKSDYIHFITKLANFSNIINIIIENMKIGISKKYTLPYIITEKLIEQLEELLKTKSYLNKNIKFKLDFNFNNTVESLLVPPILYLIDFLKKDYLPKCRKSIGMIALPNGIKEYQYLVNSSTTMNNINIDKIHQYGVSEVSRIYNLMNEIKKKLNFKGTLKEFNNLLRKRKDLNYKSKEELLQNYKNELKNINKTIMKTQFHNSIKGKCMVLPVPEYNEDFSAEAYYMGGDLENTRSGKFYINLKNIKENNKIEIESLTLHEANPGHHYQITYVNESKKIPLFLKALQNDAYQEGWALYCENLGEYKTYESFYGKLVLEMIRALRLVVDTGIHYYGWSFKKTFNYYKKYSFDSDEQIKTQLLRYIAIPTQALSYKIGEKILLDLKKKFKGNIKDFHKKVLEHGPIPLEILIELFNN